MLSWIKEGRGKVNKRHRVRNKTTKKTRKVKVEVRQSRCGRGRPMAFRKCPAVPEKRRRAAGGGVFEGFSLFILKNRRRVPNASDAAARAALYFGRFRPHLLTPRRWERRKKQPTLAPSLSEGPPGVNTQGQSLVAGLVITFCRLRCPCVPSPAGASVFHATPPAHQRRSLLLLLLLPPPPPPPLRCVDGNSSPSAHRRVRYSFRH